MTQTQQQYQGAERRQSQTQYQGDERRRVEPVFEQPAGNPDSGSPGMSTQERKDEQQERAQQQEKDHNKF